MKWIINWKYKNVKKIFFFQKIFIRKKMSSRFFDRVFGGVKNKKNILLLIFMFQSILIIFRLIYIFYTFLFIFVFRGVVGVTGTYESKNRGLTFVTNETNMYNATQVAGASVSFRSDLFTTAGMKGKIILQLNITFY